MEQSEDDLLIVVSLYVVGAVTTDVDIVVVTSVHDLLVTVGVKNFVG